MGYCMRLTDIDFFIPKEKHQECLEVIKALDPEKEETVPDSSFMQVCTKEYKNAQTLQEAIKTWGWDIETNEEGDIDYLRFDGEKVGDEKFLFDAIAPFVREGSYIQMNGEDGDNWRWVFTKGQCIEREGKIVWE